MDTGELSTSFCTASGYRHEYEVKILRCASGRLYECVVRELGGMARPSDLRSRYDGRPPSTFAPSVSSPPCPN